MIYALLAAGSSAAMKYQQYTDDTCTTIQPSGGDVDIATVTAKGTPTKGTGGQICLAAEQAGYKFGLEMTMACPEKQVALQNCGEVTCEKCLPMGIISFPDGVPTADGCHKATDSVNLALKSVKLEGFDSTFYICASDAPCFARDTMATLADGSSIPMSEVTAGDYLSTGRVIVNQHKNAAHLQSSLLKVEHAEGSISLTPDHVLNVDGSFVAAREAIVGSKLGNSEVSRVTRSSGGIINPLTTTGQIMADGVLASTYPEWIAGYMLGRSTASASSALSFLFPATTQAYYDAHLEQFFQSTFPTLASLATLPAPVIALIFLVADLAVAAGFVAFSLASLKSVVALFAVGAALQSRK